MPIHQGVYTAEEDPQQCFYLQCFITVHENAVMYTHISYNFNKEWQINEIEITVR